MVMSWKMGVVACGFGLMINWRVKEALGSFDLQFGVMICLMQIDKRIQNALHTHSQSRGHPTFEVDIAYAPFIERYQAFLLDAKNFDITANRPKLATCIEELDKVEGYKQIKRDPKEHVENFKRRFAVQP